jgi:asparagine synthetase A
MDAVIDNLYQIKENTDDQKDFDTISSAATTLEVLQEAVDDIYAVLEKLERNVSTINAMEKVGHAVYRAQCEECSDGL